MASENKTETESTHASRENAASTPRMTIRPLKTYRGDAEEAIQRQKESIASIALLEQKKREEERKLKASRAINPDTKKKIVTTIAVVIGVITVGGGIFALIRYGNFSFMKTAPNETVVVKSDSLANFIIPPRYEREVDSTANNSKNTLAGTIEDEAGKTQEAGIITNISLTQARVQGLPDLVSNKSNLPAGMFLNTYFTNVPDVLIRALDDNFMLGVYYDNTQKGHVFLIFKTNSFETSFAGMLAWEKTLPQDLGLIVGAKEGVGGFKDVVMRNKDTRALLDRTLEPVFMYSFIDRSTILVTSDKETFGSILDILNQPKRVTQ